MSSQYGIAWKKKETGINEILKKKKKAAPT
jgi:hypothetical protein